MVLGTISKKDLKLALRIGEIRKTTTTTKLIEIGKDLILFMKDKIMAEKKEYIRPFMKDKEIVLK